MPPGEEMAGVGSVVAGGGEDVCGGGLVEARWGEGCLRQGGWWVGGGGGRVWRDPCRGWL